MLEEIIAARLREVISLDTYDMGYQVNLPLYYADGDALRIILKPEPDGRWCLTDEAHTMMYLSYYDIKVEHVGLRRNVLNKILAQHDVQEHDGRIVMEHISKDGLADAIFDFSAALLSLGDFTLWKKEVSRSRFEKDFQKAVQVAARGRECCFNYFDHDHDPNHDYPIDCLISGKNNKNVHVYAIDSDYKARGAVISIYHYREYLSAQSCAVLSRGKINERSRTQLHNVHAKTFNDFDDMIIHLPAQLDDTCAAD